MIVIELPWPSKDLHAHAGGFRGSQWKKIDATAASRHDGRIIGIKALSDNKGWMMPKKAYISYRFMEPNHRHRDQGNLIQMMKGYIDGIVDSKVICGDHSAVLQIIGCVSDWSDKKNPRVVITITPHL